MTNLVPFFQRAEPFKTTFEHIQANMGSIAALNKDGSTCTLRMFGALGRVSDQKPMVARRRHAFITGICNVYIPRAAQMSEHRGAQSQRSQSKWSQIDERNCPIRRACSTSA